MGKRGPAPKPTRLKVIEGNPGKRPLNMNEPQPTARAPECPEWLDDEAKAEWNRVVPELERLGLLSVVDRTAMAGYCKAYSRWVQAEMIIEQEGLTFAAPSGYVQQRPEVSIAQKSLQLVKAFCQEFGLSPSSRGRLTLPSEKTDENAMSELLSS